MRWGVPILFFVVGLVEFGWVAAEMHLGRSIDVPLGRNKSVQAGSAVLSAAAFLVFVWWIFTMVRRVKSTAAHDARRG